MKYKLCLMLIFLITVQPAMAGSFYKRTGPAVAYTSESTLGIYTSTHHGRVDAITVGYDSEMAALATVMEADKVRYRNGQCEADIGKGLFGVGKMKAYTHTDGKYEQIPGAVHKLVFPCRPVQ